MNPVVRPPHFHAHAHALALALALALAHAHALALALALALAHALNKISEGMSKNVEGKGRRDPAPNAVPVLQTAFSLDF
jgi:hypothetical protein